LSPNLRFFLVLTGVGEALAEKAISATTPLARRTLLKHSCGSIGRSVAEEDVLCGEGLYQSLHALPIEGEVLFLLQCVVEMGYRNDCLPSADRC
jgi:hypothetical protein